MNTFGRVCKVDQPPVYGRKLQARLQEAYDTPWRITNNLWRLLYLPYIKTRFALSGIAWGQQWRIYGMPIIQRHRQSTITLGDGLELRSWYSANPLAPYHPVVLSTRQAGAMISIGKHCGLTGASVIAAKRVEIGDYVLLGANTIVVDTDFHPLSSLQREQGILGGASKDVVIEDNVFIGMNSLILKGVTIGRGSVVGAGSVIVSDIPPNTVAAGNPAKIIKQLDNEYAYAHEKR